MIEASLVWGNKSITSQIAHWTIVDFDSPAYKLCDVLVQFTYVFHSPTEARRSVLVVLQNMLELFKEGRARPRDLLPDGTTIFHVGAQSRHCVELY
jgi:hypothetical protein